MKSHSLIVGVWDSEELLKVKGELGWRELRDH